MYHWISIHKPDDLDKLKSAVSADFSPKKVIARLRTTLSPSVKGILVEYPYVDKDYRSTYYGFYSKKGLRYEPFCARLHFFDGSVRYKDLNFDWDRGGLHEHYFGYMVLRPTPIRSIGRTVLSVGAVDGFASAIIVANHVVHLLGHRLTVRGFPFMQQHTDISVCAHAACWGVLRHNSERHRRYAEFPIYDITKMASDSDPGGLSPSRGLALDQASRVFSSAGLYPDTYFKEDFPKSFYRMLHAYVDSGFPVFAAMNKRKHAINIIGHGQPDRKYKGVRGPQYAWDAINSFVVVDDNLMPYHVVDFLDSKPYKIKDIDAFIVPLPEKIFLPAEAVERRVRDILTKGFPKLDMRYLKNPMVRYYVTTSATLKRCVQEQRSAFSPSFYTALSELVMPQFVWVVELANLTDWRNSRFNALMILDATASSHEAVPFFLVHDQKNAFIFDRGVQKEWGWMQFDRPLLAMSEFRPNLDYRF